MVLGLIHKIIIIQGSWMKQNLKKTTRRLGWHAKFILNWIPYYGTVITAGYIIHVYMTL